jgi:hypothetical protein
MFNPYNHLDPTDPTSLFWYDPLPEHPTQEELDLYQRLCVKSIVHGFLVFLAAILLIALASLFTGCTTTKYVTVPEVHSDTVRITQHQRDSIVLRDSIYVNQYQRGDTVFLQVDRWHTSYRDRWHTDTAYISRRDSIPVPVPVEKAVPAKLSWFQQLQLWLGRLVLVALAVLTGIWLIRKRAWWLRLFLKHE